jgi:hypothetical protein
LYLKIKSPIINFNEAEGFMGYMENSLTAIYINQGLMSINMAVNVNFLRTFGGNFPN